MQITLSIEEAMNLANKALLIYNKDLKIYLDELFNKLKVKISTNMKFKGWVSAALSGSADFRLESHNIIKYRLERIILFAQDIKSLDRNILNVIVSYDEYMLLKANPTIDRYKAELEYESIR